MYNYIGCIIPQSVVFPHQSFRILDPDPQYSQNDHFREKKKSESKVVFLECAVAVIHQYYHF
jgi:hypothetical protein